MIKKSVICLFCLMFLASASLYSATYNIVGNRVNPNDITWQDFANAVNNNQTAGNIYYLMDDVGVPSSSILTTPVTQMLGGTFRGRFDGNNHLIYVDIDTNATNVGLFSQVAGVIQNLIVDGSVVGGYASQYVGGLVGEFLSSNISNCTNLADVTGLANNSSVGGIVGIVAGGDVYECVNNGTITGGQHIAGIIGVTIEAGIRFCKNAGTIQCNNVVVDGGIYIAGITAYCNNTYMHNSVNIGKILSSNSNYAGGIVARIFKGSIGISANSGIVDGAIYCVGGIVGCIEPEASIYECLNTNWVTGTSQSSGSIAGINNGYVENCFYDNQMSVPLAIGAGLQGTNTPQNGLVTNSMTGNNLSAYLCNGMECWHFQNNLYPRTGYNTGPPDHPIILLSAAPIYLQDNPITGDPERLDNVTAPFYVSNYFTVPPFLPPPPIPFPYLWGSFSNTLPWIHYPNSIMNFISVPPPPSNIANVFIPRQDTLSVQLDYNWLISNNYNGFYSGNYSIFFEKQIPINVGR